MGENKAIKSRFIIIEMQKKLVEEKDKKRGNKPGYFHNLQGHGEITWITNVSKRKGSPMMSTNKCRNHLIRAKRALTNIPQHKGNALLPLSRHW